MKAQRLVIGTADETITCAVIEQAFRKVCVLTKSGLQFLDSDNEDLNDLEDLQLPTPANHIVGTEPSAQPESGTNTSSISSIKPISKKQEENKQVDVIGDLNRIHHPEFKIGLKRLVGRNLSASGITDFEVIRNCRLASDPYEALAQQGYSPSSPIKLF